MTGYILRRILMMLPTLLGITLLVFAVSRIAPGSPAESSRSLDGAWEADRAAEVLRARRELYGLDGSLPRQYVRWLGRVVRLDFGDSIRLQRPVRQVLAERLPVTILLNALAFVVIYAVSLPLGVWQAGHCGRWSERLSSLGLILLWSLPTIWVGQLLIGFFCGPTHWQWFPPAGLSSVQAEGWPFFTWLADRLWHLVLPVACLSYTGLAYLTQQVRGGTLETLGRDYIRTAWAKGLSRRQVMYRHALRNGLLPLITLTAGLLAALISGSVIIESIFSIPGMGRLAFEAVTARDYNVIMAVATLAGLLNLAGLLLADIAYALADPRVRFSGGYE
ncbi:MAG: ABC transporter permease [Sedimentisphaerales bacterium]|nr:ABC transporter permease [Sedimentisphaerales bacterium]